MAEAEAVPERGVVYRVTQSSAPYLEADLNRLQQAGAAVMAVIPSVSLEYGEPCLLIVATLPAPQGRPHQSHGGQGRGAGDASPAEDR